MILLYNNVKTLSCYIYNEAHYQRLCYHFLLQALSIISPNQILCATLYKNVVPII